MGMALPAGDAREVFKEIALANPYYQEIAMGGFWGKDLFPAGFPTLGGKARFLPLTIDLSTCTHEKQPLLATENYLHAKIKGKLVV